MKVEQRRWSKSSGWETGIPREKSDESQLVLVFGSREALKNPSRIAEIRSFYPASEFIGCSTAGEIAGVRISDDTLAVTAVRFEHSSVRVFRDRIGDAKESRDVGHRLASKLEQTGLVHVFVISDGLKVNGSELVKGITAALPPYVTVTGGLSADGEKFEETVVLSNEAAESGVISLVGLYGDRLKVGYGSLGGWDTFGPRRKITRSTDNVLYELDGKSALDLYRTYLGPYADGLPATGLLFPLCIVTDGNPKGVVRTILSTDDSAKSLTFAGDIPEGASAYLMRANFDRLIDGAMGASKTSAQSIGGGAELSILISCVGRRLILKQRTEEEVEAVRDIQGPDTVLTGFYSYGEIAPFITGERCELHNQTMTITTLSESRSQSCTLS